MDLNLLLATNNTGKLEEYQAMLGNFAARLMQPRDLALDLDVPETGQTYAENAALKAAAFADALAALPSCESAAGSGLRQRLPAGRILVLADDSGLEVEALNGAPGLHSARFAAEAAPGRPGDAGRRAFLLEKLRPHPFPWHACFRCTIAIADPLAGSMRFAEGICPGIIIPTERGSNGFGYDPIFYMPGYGRTMAELSMEEKNQVSHRARALFRARAMLEEQMRSLLCSGSQ